MRNGLILLTEVLGVVFFGPVFFVWRFVSFLHANAQTAEMTYVHVGISNSHFCGLPTVSTAFISITFLSLCCVTIIIYLWYHLNTTNVSMFIPKVTNDPKVKLPTRNLCFHEHVFSQPSSWSHSFFWKIILDLTTLEYASKRNPNLEWFSLPDKESKIL